MEGLEALGVCPKGKTHSWLLCSLSPLSHINSIRGLLLHSPNPRGEVCVITGTETALGRQLSRVLILHPDYKGSSLIKQI